MKTLMMVTALCVVLAAGGFARAQESGPKQDKDPPNVAMKLKLELSKRILAALAESDFASLERCAKDMRTLSDIEAFVKRDTPGYQTHLQVFLFSNEELLRHAEGKNLAGATLAFTQMTISCVNCHQAMRKY